VGGGIVSNPAVRRISVGGGYGRFLGKTREDVGWTDQSGQQKCGVVFEDDVVKLAAGWPVIFNAKPD